MREARDGPWAVSCSRFSTRVVKNLQCGPIRSSANSTFLVEKRRNTEEDGMRKALVPVLVLLAAGCSKGPGHDPGRERGGGSSAENSASADVAAAPGGIAPTAAPGVAFNYKYAFRLPAERI